MILMLPLTLEAQVILCSVTSTRSVVSTWAISPSVNFNCADGIGPKFLLTLTPLRDRCPREA